MPLVDRQEGHPACKSSARTVILQRLLLSTSLTWSNPERRGQLKQN